MDYQDHIIEFLRKPENLPIALEVVKHTDALRIHLHKAFWPDIYTALKARLEVLPISDRWVVSKPLAFDRDYKCAWSLVV